MEEIRVAHRMRLVFNERWLTRLLTIGTILQPTVVVKGLPETAFLVGMHFDPIAGCWNLVYEDPSFPATPLGQLLPMMDIVHEAIAAGEAPDHAAMSIRQCEMLTAQYKGPDKPISDLMKFRGVRVVPDASMPDGIVAWRRANGDILRIEKL